MSRTQRLASASAAFVAVGTAALISAAAAHADDFTTILADVTATAAAGTTAFTTSAADFAALDYANGLTQLFIGLDDYVYGIPDELQVGTIDVLTGAPLFPLNDFLFNFAAPATQAAAIAEAQSFYVMGNNLATTILGLPATDYANVALDNALSYNYEWVISQELVFIGVIESLGTHF